MGRIDHHRPLYPEPQGQFKRSYHLEMVTDRQRTAAVTRALEEVLRPDHVFCELGCGTAIFSLFAAGFCKKVYAIENDPKMVEIAKRNIMASGLDHKVELIFADAAEVTLPERADVVFCEMMSIWCIEEPQIPIFNLARDGVLKPDGLFLPMRIVNLAELGYFKFSHHGISMEAAMPLFTGIPRTGIMTERKVCKVLDFTQQVDADLSCEATFQSFGEGVINCAKLTSLVQMGPRTIFSGSDSLMPLTVVPLDQPLEVKFGEKLMFQAEAHGRMDLNECRFQVRKL